MAGPSAFVTQSVLAVDKSHALVTLNGFLLPEIDDSAGSARCGAIRPGD